MYIVDTCLYLYIVIYVIVRKAFVKKCIHKLFISVGARLVGGVVGVVERLALSSGAFLPPKVLSSYIGYCTKTFLLVLQCK